MEAYACMLGFNVAWIILKLRGFLGLENIKKNNIHLDEQGYSILTFDELGRWMNEIRCFVESQNASTMKTS